MTLYFGGKEVIEWSSIVIFSRILAEQNFMEVLEFVFIAAAFRTFVDWENLNGYIKRVIYLHCLRDFITFVMTRTDQQQTQPKYDTGPESNPGCIVGGRALFNALQAPFLHTTFTCGITT